MLDNYGVISRLASMKKKRRENYTVPGPDWLWCLDRHDKHARYGALLKFPEPPLGIINRERNTRELALGAAGGFQRASARHK
jgi:hypothetical protein